MMEETLARYCLVNFAASLFQRGFTVGSSGNISVRLSDGFLVTPTNSCFGHLDAQQLSKLDVQGEYLSGDRPSKEWSMHKALLDTRPTDNAVVHLHSPYATALSCLNDLDPDDCIPSLTPYFVMRVGKAKLLPYFRPGSIKIADTIRDLNGSYSGILLANHGPVVSSVSLSDAIYAAEEMEEACRIAILTKSFDARRLSVWEVDELRAVFGQY